MVDVREYKPRTHPEVKGPLREQLKLPLFILYDISSRHATEDLWRHLLATQYEEGELCFKASAEPVQNQDKTDTTRGGELHRRVHYTTARSLGRSLGRSARRRSLTAARSVICWRPWVAVADRPPPLARSAGRPLAQSIAPSLACRRFVDRPPPPARSFCRSPRSRSRAAAGWGICWRPWVTFGDRPPRPDRSLARSLGRWHRRSGGLGPPSSIARRCPFARSVDRAVRRCCYVLLQYVHTEAVNKNERRSCSFSVRLK